MAKVLEPVSCRLFINLIADKIIKRFMPNTNTYNDTFLRFNHVLRAYNNSLNSDDDDNDHQLEAVLHPEEWGLLKRLNKSANDKLHIPKIPTWSNKKSFIVLDQFTNLYHRHADKNATCGNMSDLEILVFDKMQSSNNNHVSHFDQWIGLIMNATRRSFFEALNVDICSIFNISSRYEDQRFYLGDIVMESRNRTQEKWIFKDVDNELELKRAFEEISEHLELNESRYLERFNSETSENLHSIEMMTTEIYNQNLLIFDGTVRERMLLNSIWHKLFVPGFSLRIMNSHDFSQVFTQSKKTALVF